MSEQRSKAALVAAALFCGCSNQRFDHIDRNDPIDVQTSSMVDIYRDNQRGVTCYRVMQGISCLRDPPDGGR